MRKQNYMQIENIWPENERASNEIKIYWPLGSIIHDDGTGESSTPKLCLACENCIYLVVR